MIKMSTTGFLILLWAIVRSLDNQTASLETFCQGLRDFVHKSRKRVRTINRS